MAKATKPKSKPLKNGRKTGGNPPVEHRFKPGNPGGPGRPPVKHIRERILELMADGVIDQDKLIHELRSEDRALFTAYAFGRPQVDITSKGEHVGGVLVIGPQELEDV